ncbi:MAG: hypothetical protein LKI58_11410 [Actinomyces sp.]|nr:hypothetical protein [Actinomyces sp.]MCI1642517.1 hypothetical protein [Actinomyces sp.]MCI1663050.1 hypothetical protein [Actinomyces sp.]MCI1691688.1 hypothetical protein [Actinomyces sp.]MCI1788644.1 hypothetical protein [Actinomyces sp.]MCI1829746.1 hypothetical protein [Actinomyces sp.]
MNARAVRVVRRAARAQVVTSAAGLLAHATPWMESELAALRPVVPVVGTCLDVGAAAGFYTAELSRLVGLREGANVRRPRAAMGRERCRATISVPLRNGQFVTGRSFVTRGAHGLGSNAEFDDHAEFVVAVETIDDLAADEGLDWLDVLARGEHAIDRYAPAVLLEIEERHLQRFDRAPAMVVDWMTGRGYRMLAWRDHRRVPADAVTDEVSTRNYLFVPKARRGELG